jgi:2-oxoglutarate ferredoxin oxidoreductase subunit delta
MAAQGAVGRKSLDWGARPAAHGAPGAGLSHGRHATGNLYPTKQRVHHAPTIVDYVNIRWVDDWCKRCNICVEICPKDSLVLTHDAILEVEDCIRCGLCERYCPDLAIEVLPEAAPAGAVEAAARQPAAAARAAPRATDSTGARPRVSLPDVARGPAVAGTDPTRGITDRESDREVDRANQT